MEKENDNTTIWTATHPGKILMYELEERGISQKDFAQQIGMQRSHLNELVKGKRPMTQAIADKIELALGISAIALVNMQTKYDYDIQHIGSSSDKSQNLATYTVTFDKNDKVLAGLIGIMADAGAQVTMTLKTN